MVIETRRIVLVATRASNQPEERVIVPVVVGRVRLIVLVAELELVDRVVVELE